MAEEALKKLEEQLNCSICLDTYTDPKLLQCFHVYCRQCLVPLIVRDRQGKLGLTCPICRQVTPIPDRGVTGLQSAFHINHLFEIRKSLRKVENPAVTLEEAELTHKKPAKVSDCFVHEGKKSELYCETCGELICLRCTFKGGKHHDHDYEELDEAFRKYKEEITLSLEPLEKQVVTMKKALAQLNNRCGEISNQHTATKDSVHVTFRRLREVLNVRETELIGQLDQMARGKLKRLATQKDQIEITLAKLNSCLHFMKESLKTGNKGDMLMMKTNTVIQLIELTIPSKPYALDPNAKADVIFTASADMIAVCQNYGQVQEAKQLPDFSKFLVTGEGIEAAVVGNKSTAILHAINFEGKPCEEPMSLECELVSELADTRSSCKVGRRGQSQYEISYQPTIKGRHQLHIKVDGQHIKGSPFSIPVKSGPLWPIQTISGVKEPIAE